MKILLRMEDSIVKSAMLRRDDGYREEAHRAPCAAAPDTGHIPRRMENKSDESDEIAPAQPLPATNTTAATALQAQARSDNTTSRSRGSGHGLGWSDEELTSVLPPGSI
jgi:hypothetical protein